MSLLNALREINVDLDFYAHRPVRDHGSSYDRPIVVFIHALHADDADDHSAESACLNFIREWSGHPVKRRCARFGLNLHAIRHLPEVAALVSYWEDLCNEAHESSFDQWVDDRNEYARGEWYALHRVA